MDTFPPKMDDLEKEIALVLDSSNYFDLPPGRHKSLIEGYYRYIGKEDSDTYEDKLKSIGTNWRLFYEFLATQERFQTWRLDAKRQATIEPRRIETAINALKELGFEVQIIDRTQINFKFKGEIVKYFPYSGWATGKSIKDGRGFKNLMVQLMPDQENQASDQNA